MSKLVNQKFEIIRILLTVKHKMESRVLDTKLILSFEIYHIWYAEL